MENLNYIDDLMKVANELNLEVAGRFLSGYIKTVQITFKDSNKYFYITRNANEFRKMLNLKIDNAFYLKDLTKEHILNIKEIIGG